MFAYHIFCNHLHFKKFHSGVTERVRGAPCEGVQSGNTVPSHHNLQPLSSCIQTLVGTKGPPPAFSKPMNLLFCRISRSGEFRTTRIPYWIAHTVSNLDSNLTVRRVMVIRSAQLDSVSAWSNKCCVMVNTKGCSMPTAHATDIHRDAHLISYIRLLKKSGWLKIYHFVKILKVIRPRKTCVKNWLCPSLWQRKMHLFRL